MSKTPLHPLEKIALSCSGGGYRAASFHLGAMAYLNELTYQDKPLLENVCILSTVSGGTITGIVYAQQKQQEGKTFKEIYDFLMDKLHHIDLVKEGLQKLSGKAPMVNPNKSQNLINAFAELYDQHPTNAQFTAFKGNKLVRGDKGQKPVVLNKLNITILHPNKKRLEKLQAQWDKDLKAAKTKKSKANAVGASLVDPDNSPFNLSSIVCLVELGKQKILLTGDGRSEDIYEGLKENGFLDAKGNYHVQILKMPHHGSIRNMDSEFLEKITADHYVISADGNYDNPDGPLLELMMKKIKKGTIYFTNRKGTPGVTKAKGMGKKLSTFLKKLETSKSKLKTVFKSGTPLIIDLIDKVE